jgi:hypothetical protein
MRRETDQVLGIEITHPEIALAIEGLSCENTTSETGLLLRTVAGKK